MFCSTCGASVADDAQFCSRCGAPVTVHASEGAAEQTSTRAEEPTMVAPAAVSATPPALGGSQPNWWRRRSRKAKVFLIIGGAVAALIVIGALSGGSGSSKSKTAASTPPQGASQPGSSSQPASSGPATSEPTTSTPAPKGPKPPPPIVLSGDGSKVVPVVLRASTPLVVSGSNSGSSNFIVDLHRNGSDQNLYNEIGPFSGQVAWSDAHAGRYRLAVEAEGPWRIVLTQPQPHPRAKVVPGTISGTGAKVIAIRTLRDLSPTITSRNTGNSNFIVDVIGYGQLVSGDQNVINEIGPYHGQTILDSMPQGDYLLEVIAVGPWTIKFG